MYHIATSAIRESILQYGLDWTRADPGDLVPRADETRYPYGNYLYGQRENWMQPDEWTDVWEVDVSDLDLLEDPADHDSMDDNPNNWYAEHPISPDLLRLIRI